jgi:hypothetical protein
VRKFFDKYEYLTLLDSFQSIRNFRITNTQLYLGFVIFAYIGNIAYLTGEHVDAIVQAGQGLSFVIFPYAGKCHVLRISFE